MSTWLSIATLGTALEALRIFGLNWIIGLGATYARLCEVLSSRSSSSELKNGYRPKLLTAKGKYDWRARGTILAFLGEFVSSVQQFGFPQELRP